MYSDRIGATLDQLATRGLTCRTLPAAATVVAEVADSAWMPRHVRVVLHGRKSDRPIVLAECGDTGRRVAHGSQHLVLCSIRSMTCRLEIAVPDPSPPPSSPSQVGRDLALFARQAGWFLSGIDRVENLHRALVTRSAIAQAQGILMATFDLRPDEALLVLRRRSQETQTRLADLAVALVEADPAQRLTLLR